MNKLLLIIGSVFIINFVLANPFGYNYLEQVSSTGTTDTNYSLVNVNNSQYLQGYTPTTLKDWIQGLFNSIFVPYTGATSNIDLGNKSLNTTGVLRGGTIPVNCSTAAATAAKTVTIDGYTLTSGDILAVRWMLGTTVASPTLNVNGVGAKAIRLSTTAASATTFTIGANSTTLLYYDGTVNGGYFQMMGSHRTSDSANTDYGVNSYGSITVGNATSRYQIGSIDEYGLFYTFSNGYSTAMTKPVSRANYRMGDRILWYSSTTALTTGQKSTAFYNEYYTANMVYVLNNNTGWRNDSLYIVGIPNNDANNTYKLDNTTLQSWYTQKLPSTEDGKIYILLGYIYANNSLAMYHPHTIYEYKCGRIRIYGEACGNTANYTIASGECYQYFKNGLLRDTNCSTT